MAEIALTILRYAWPWLLAAAVWGVMETRLLASEHRVTVAEGAAVKAQAAADRDALALKTAQANADAAARAYDAAQRTAQQTIEEHTHAAQATIATLQAKVAALDNTRRLLLDNTARLVLADASRTANAAGTTPGTPGSAATGTAAVPATAGVSERDLGVAWTAAAAAYADAVTLFHGCRDFYRSLNP